MSKLVSPAQYESTLGVLNQVRPLRLAGKIKQTIDIPVLNLNPPSASRPAIGKLARCDKQGALLRANSDSYGFTAYNAQSRIGYADYYATVELDRRVLGVHIYYRTRPAAGTKLYWCNDAGIDFKECIYHQWAWLEFNGYRFKMRRTFPPGMIWFDYTAYYYKE